MAKKKVNYALEGGAAKTLAAPDLKYQPPKPRHYNPPIGVIGCGGISATHLRAYKEQGYNVVALCDLIPERAENRRKEFFPDARTYTDYRELLKRDDLQVIDIPTHPPDREYLIPAALKAGKHVLSQKPFVLDLDKGERFAELAEKLGVKLAVNQNGRWAPYFSYIRQAINKGLLGTPNAVHLACHWDHEWIRNTHFNDVHHVVLYDFAIHWFDMLNAIMQGKPAKRVIATLTHGATQKSTPPLLGQALVDYDGAQASLIFDACCQFSNRETAFIAGSKADLLAVGTTCRAHDVTITSKKGTARKTDFAGSWFPEGFKGSMGELLCAIEQKRAPINNARNNLEGLALAFAAVRSAESGKPEVPGKVRKIPAERCGVPQAKG